MELTLEGDDLGVVKLTLAGRMRWAVSYKESHDPYPELDEGRLSAWLERTKAPRLEHDPFNPKRPSDTHETSPALLGFVRTDADLEPLESMRELAILRVDEELVLSQAGDSVGSYIDIETGERFTLHATAN